MGKNIYLTESQFNMFVENVCVNEGIHKTAKTKSFAEKIKKIVIPQEIILNQQKPKMSLFADGVGIKSLELLAQMIDNKEITVKQALDEPIFRDEQARQLVNQWLTGTRCTGENIYADAITNNNIPRLKGEEEARKAAKNNGYAQIMAAKVEEYSEYFSDPQFTCDAYNYYVKCKGGDFPIDVSNKTSMVSLNEKLKPYFKKDSGYKPYMLIKEICRLLNEQTASHGAVYAFDGLAVYAPIVGKPFQDKNGYHPSVSKNGVKQMPCGWDTLLQELRKRYNVGTLGVTNSKPRCFYIPVSFM